MLVHLKVTGGINKYATNTRCETNKWPIGHIWILEGLTINDYQLPLIIYKLVLFILDLNQIWCISFVSVMKLCYSNESDLL